MIFRAVSNRSTADLEDTWAKQLQSLQASEEEEDNGLPLQFLQYTSEVLCHFSCLTEGSFSFRHPLSESVSCSEPWRASAEQSYFFPHRSSSATNGPGPHLSPPCSQSTPYCSWRISLLLLSEAAPVARPAVAQVGHRAIFHLEGNIWFESPRANI